MTLAKLVILNSSTVTVSPSYVILNEVKNLRANAVKDLWQNDLLPAPLAALSPPSLASGTIASL
jgi:hypothetical protein